MLIATGITIIVIFLSTIIIRRVRQYKEKYKNMMLTQGFRLRDNLDDRIINAMCELHRIKRDRIAISEIYEYSHFYHKFYRVRIDVRGSDKSSEILYVLYNSSFDLPRFSIIPNMNLSGFLGTMLKAIIKKLGSRVGLTEYRLPDNPKFSEKYTLLTDNNTDSELLNQIPWDKLAYIPHYLVMDARDDLILIQIIMSEDKATNKKLRSHTNNHIDLYLQVSEQINDFIHDSIKQYNSEKV